MPRFPSSWRRKSNLCRLRSHERSGRDLQNIGSFGAVSFHLAIEFRQPFYLSPRQLVGQRKRKTLQNSRRYPRLHCILHQICGWLDRHKEYQCNLWWCFWKCYPHRIQRWNSTLQSNFNFLDAKAPWCHVLSRPTHLLPEFVKAWC